jgi:hypothetical protein
MGGSYRVALTVASLQRQPSPGWVLKLPNRLSLCRFLLNAVETVLTAVGFVLGILTWRGTRRPG